MAELIRSGREKALLTQQELAERSGVSERTVRRIEADGYRPYLATIRSLANALNLTGEEQARLVAAVSGTSPGNPMAHPHSPQDATETEPRQQPAQPRIPPAPARRQAGYGRGPAIAGSIPGRSWCFQRRPAEQARLRRALAGEGLTAVALIGPRGVGKTQLAAAYAHECVKDGLAFIAWVNAECGLVNGLARMAEQLGLRVNDHEGTQQLAERTLTLLRQQRMPGSLVVFDNVEDVAELAAWLPTTGTTRVIVTSNRQEIAVMPAVTVIDVGVFHPEHGRSFLSQATGLPAGAECTEVGEQLGWLPLGLAQAGAYIKHNSLTYRQYLSALEQHHASETWAAVPGLGHPGIMDATRLSISALSRTGPGRLGALILAVLSLLATAGTSRRLLSTPAGTNALRADAAQISAALRRLSTASLVAVALSDGDDPHTDTAAITVHRLTARVVRHLDHPGAQAAAVCFLTRLTEALPFSQVTLRRAELDEIVSHVIALQGNCKPRNHEMLQLSSWAAKALTSAGDFTRARHLLESTLTAMETLLGPVHPDTVVCRNNLAHAYFGEEDLSRSAHLYRSNLTMLEQALGHSHPDTLIARNNYANVLRGQGYPHKALELYLSTIADRRRVLGPEHHQTTVTQGNIGLAYLDLNRHEEAVTALRQTLDTFARVAGSTHRDTLQARRLLGRALLKARKVGDAVSTLQTATKDLQDHIGATHPDCLMARADLAIAYTAAKMHRRAADLIAAVLHDSQSTFGPRHPITRRINASWDELISVSTGSRS